MWANRLVWFVVVTILGAGMAFIVAGAKASAYGPY